MKKIALLSAMSAVLLAGCSSVEVGPSEEAVLISKPYFFGSGGVLDEPVRTGREYVAWSTDSITVRTAPVKYTIPFDDLMTKDGIPIDFEAVMVLQVTDSVYLIRHFGEKWYSNNLEGVFRSLVRDAVRKYGMNEVAIDTAKIAAIDAEVTAGISAFIKENKIPVRLVNMTVGKANPPTEIKEGRVETAKEEQRANTEAKRTEAERGRRDTEIARAEADKAYAREMGYTPDQLIQMKNIEMMQSACGGGNCTFFVGDTRNLQFTRGK